MAAYQPKMGKSGEGDLKKLLHILPVPLVRYRRKSHRLPLAVCLQSLA